MKPLHPGLDIRYSDGAHRRLQAGRIIELNGNRVVVSRDRGGIANVAASAIRAIVKKVRD